MATFCRGLCTRAYCTPRTVRGTPSSDISEQKRDCRCRGGLTVSDGGPNDLVRGPLGVDLPGEHLGATVGLEVVVELHAPVY